MRSLKMNKKGQLEMMVNLLIFVMVIFVAIAMIPVLRTMLNVAQQSDGLNCAGYCYNGDCSHSLSYNSTLAEGGDTNSLACMAIKLYLPYILLIVLVGGVSKILYSRSVQPQFG